ncbi:hypothetical protein H5410_056989 [Solanum commersonii]|uniref:Uncharacterized protein n=1 Tax=Solanum commersonii TaxID=4109 RepID=A0A9J5WNU5_SOLCO|nr:hypothetical protein H5410_056989 [Solanum commersonii]
MSNNELMLLGDLVLLCRTTRRHADCTISSPIRSCPLRISTLEQKAITIPFVDLPTGLVVETKCAFEDTKPIKR